MTFAAPAPRRFAALYNPSCAVYLLGGMLTMMADNVEHVITYWQLWIQFHSPALVGFEVISHWAPFLFLSVASGALADRFDCRRVIQAGLVLFMAVSAAWGVLFATHSLTVGAACVLLVLHGVAGVLWAPAEQLMLHDFVGAAELPSAVRLNSTARSLGILFGPVVGSVLLVGLGSTVGIFVNIAIYVPLLVFLFITPVTGHVRDHGRPRPRVRLRDSIAAFGLVRHDRVLLSMLILAGLGAFFVGASLQTAMPAFAGFFGGNGLGYGALLLALGAGGVLGGVLLEAVPVIRPTTRSALVATAVFGVTTLGFSLTRSYPLALVLLFITGIGNLASMSITQTVVQLLAPPAERGRVVGLYGVAASGLRIGSGFTVGLLGSLTGVPTALALSAAAMCVGVAATVGITGGRASRTAPSSA